MKLPSLSAVRLASVTAGVVAGIFALNAHAKDSGVASENEEAFLARLPEKPRISDQQWSDVVGSVTEERYIIQTGDTLWEICAKFLDSPFYWPKLWEVNQQAITNPHQLKVGQEIRFLSGSGTALPSMDSGQDSLGSPPEVSVEEKAPDYKDESFQVFPPTPEKKTVDDLGFVKGLVVKKEIHELIRPHGMIVKETIANYGEIVGAYPSRTYFGPHDVFYVDLEDRTPVKVGERYSIFKYEGRVVDPDSALGFALGYWVRILGEVKVHEVKGRKARVEVLRAYDEIVRGNFLTKLYPYVSDLKPRYLKTDLKADIVQLNDQHKTFDGSGGVVFLNRGTNDGVLPGTVFNIIHTKDGVTETDEFVRPEVKGKVMVFSSETFSSAAMIVSSGQEFFIGDLAISARGP
jgi:hypothetical protein